MRRVVQDGLKARVSEKDEGLCFQKLPTVGKMLPNVGGGGTLSTVTNFPFMGATASSQGRKTEVTKRPRSPGLGGPVYVSHTG